jgi:hypothetical protein
VQFLPHSKDVDGTIAAVLVRDVQVGQEGIDEQDQACGILAIDPRCNTRHLAIGCLGQTWFSHPALSFPEYNTLSRQTRQLFLDLTCVYLEFSGLTQIKAETVMD